MHLALVVEDQDLMRLALMAELRGRLRDCYLAGAPTLDLARELLAEDRFDLVVTDPGLPGFDPTSREDRLLVVETIVKAAPAATHVVVTGSYDQDEAMAFRLLGAKGYICKTGLSQGDLPLVVDQIAQGDFLLRLSQMESPRPEMRFPTLSPREEEILGMMMSRTPGTRRREIFETMALKAGINASSAEKYYKQARAKLLKLGRLPKGL
ncbi:response regulator [Chelativorans sp. AA-79]|uniref:response regulator n=1 Tax=Chelativorans sp. AA-79 TaxID=3028735 RepID=UPI0023F7BCB5|nr:response regulator [Chelativorans sp. AA-79]WEX12332.1 response regulator [Chelativorans sp. AA-79]